jgi:hypothetical protein
MGHRRRRWNECLRVFLFRCKLPGLDAALALSGDVHPEGCVLTRIADGIGDHWIPNHLDPSRRIALVGSRKPPTRVEVGELVCCSRAVWSLNMTARRVASIEPSADWRKSGVTTNSAYPELSAPAAHRAPQLSSNPMTNLSPPSVPQRLRRMLCRCEWNISH